MVKLMTQGASKKRNNVKIGSGEIIAKGGRRFRKRDQVNGHRRSQKLGNGSN